jgi:8-oxo-dGTP pyrophosphatase MutT (NUDIX family)
VSDDFCFFTFYKEAWMKVRPLHEVLKDFPKLGAPSLECPRGFPFKGKKSQETAVREAGEELGSPVLESKLIGYSRPNSTFHPHQIPIYLVRVDEEFRGTVPADVNEKILKVTYYPAAEVKNMIKAKKITRGMTKSAICSFLCLE